MKRNMLTDTLANTYQQSAVPLPPSQLNATATSTSGGSPFGSHPDLSGLTPQQIASITEGLSHLTYSVPAGGYRFNNANYIGNFQGVDARANQLAAKIYGLIGEQPTVPNMTTALTNLYRQTGGGPTQGPSINQSFRNAGLPGEFKGPFEFNGYHPFSELMNRYGLGG